MCYLKSIKAKQNTILTFKNSSKPIVSLQASTLFDQSVKRCFDLVQWPIIRVDETGDWNAIPMEWGLIPNWIRNRKEATEFRYKFPTYNAVGEEILEKKSFATPTRKLRCLIPCSGFFEYMHRPKIGKKKQELKATEKFPYRITVKDKPLFFFAGIYSPWFDHEKDDYIGTYSICTQVAGNKMEVIHNIKKRQPVILTDDLAEIWLDPVMSDSEIKEILTTQFDNSQLEAYSINSDFLNSKDPEQPVKYDNIPERI